MGSSIAASRTGRDGNKERLLLGTNDAYLIAVDAKTGALDTAFGQAGRVDLMAGLANAVRATNYSVTAAPMICRDVVVVGASIHDGPTHKEWPRGDISGFDVRTGKRLWTLHSIPQKGEFGNETWGDDSASYSGSTNVWTNMSADEELGLVYLPFGTPTDDWYGGHRPGANLFAESLVALDAQSGKRAWHFQAVHHGVWDYDFPAAPILIDIKVNGKDIKAVAQVSKQGFTYVFDRKTGTPVWPIEERPVPQSTIPGERTSPTQPFPTRPPAFERQGITENDLIDFTPELRQRRSKRSSRSTTDRSSRRRRRRGTIQNPGWAGGANWAGAAVDPETGTLYVPSMTSPIVVQLVKPDPKLSNLLYVRGGVMMPPTPRRLADPQAAVRARDRDRLAQGRHQVDVAGRRRPARSSAAEGSEAAAAWRAASQRANGHEEPAVHRDGPGRISAAAGRCRSEDARSARRTRSRSSFAPSTRPPARRCGSSRRRRARWRRR